MHALLAFLFTLLAPALALAQEDAARAPNMEAWTYWGAIAFGLFVTLVGLYFAERSRVPPPRSP